MAGWFAIKLLGYWNWLLLTAFVSFLYSAPKIPYSIFRGLKKIAIGKTIFLSLVWTHSTVILPLIISGSTWEMTHFLFTINRFFLIYCICILFDYRDKDEDKNEGIKSLVTYLPDTKIKNLYFLSLLIFFGTGITLLFHEFSLSTIIALLFPGIILAACFSFFKRSASDYLYYFFLDGLMVLSALLIFLIRFN
jgi:1,4-dihydroxy-2-naphthoate octaprenyltransferase